MLGSLLLGASRLPLVRHAVSGVPLTRKVVDRFVAGETPQEAVEAIRGLAATGLAVTVDHLGEETTDSAAATRTARAYVTLLGALGGLGLGDRAEVSVKLSAVGQALGADGDKIALENARQICEAAGARGANVTLDMEDHTTVDSTLETLRALREDFPSTGVAVQSYLFRSEADCATWRTRGRGSAWSRAPTPSPPRWRTGTRARSTRPTCAACGSSCRVRATRWWRRTTTG